MVALQAVYRMRRQQSLYGEMKGEMKRRLEKDREARYMHMYRAAQKKSTLSVVQSCFPTFGYSQINQFKPLKTNTKSREMP